MKIRYRVGSSMLVIVALTVGLAAYASFTYLRLQRSVQVLSGDYFQVVVATEGMFKELDRLEIARLQGQVTGGEPSLAEFRGHRNQFSQWYNEVETRTAFDRGATPLVDSINTAFNLYLTSTANAFRLVQSGRPGEAAQAGSAAASVSGELRRLIFRLSERYQVGVSTTADNVEQKAREAARLLTYGSGAVALICIVLALALTRALVRPLERLTQTVRAIGKGRLDQKVIIRSHDEVADLGRAFNRMTERLAVYEALNVQELVAEKRKSEGIVATIPSPVIVTDDEGHVLLLNEAAAAVLGVAEGIPARTASDPAAAPRTEDYRGRPLADVVQAPPLRSLIASVTDHTRAGGDGAAPSASVRNLEGEEGAIVELEVEGAPRFFRVRRREVEVGRTALHVALLEDVTHFKRLDRLKTDFIAAVSHELRTPLMSIGLAVDLLRQTGDAALTDLQRELLDSVKDDQVRLKRLVNGLLALARVESGTYAPARETVRVADLAEEAAAPLRLAYLERGVHLVVKVPDGLPTFVGDLQHLGWVVSNLVGNALRYTPGGGTVTVAAEEAPGALLITVRDTGVGIPPDDLEAIFGAFVQLKHRNESTPGSLGLGLNLARRVVEAHGGRIWAESVPGQGSAFYVSLPLEAGEENGPWSRASGQLPPGQAEGLGASLPPLDH